jgi:hypothetical protein
MSQPDCDSMSFIISFHVEKKETSEFETTVAVGKRYIPLASCADDLDTSLILTLWRMVRWECMWQRIGWHGRLGWDNMLKSPLTRLPKAEIQSWGWKLMDISSRKGRMDSLLIIIASRRR